MSDAVVAIHAAEAHATSAQRIAGEAAVLDDPDPNPIELERRDAALRAAEAVQQQAAASIRAAEAGASRPIDIVA